MAWLSYIELDKTVALWSDWLVSHDYGFSLSALWCPLTTPTILLGFLLPWTWWYLFMAPPAKHSRCSLPWMRGMFSRCPSWPWMWSSSSEPSFAGQPLLLAGGVAPFSHRPYPWACASSFRPPPLTLDVGKRLSAMLLRVLSRLVPFTMPYYN